MLLVQICSEQSLTIFVCVLNVIDFMIYIYVIVSKIEKPTELEKP